jgi:hypothetical protein
LERAGIDPLDGELEEATMAVLLRRVNQAIVALGGEPLAAIPEESCEPDSACRCVLGEHLHVQAMYDSVRFQMPLDAERVAAAWGTEVNEAGRVKLPEDLRLATAAFDHGMLPDLIDPELWTGPEIDPSQLPDLEEIAQAVSPHGVR